MGLAKLVPMMIPFLLVIATYAETRNKLLIELNEPKGSIRGHILKSANNNEYYAYQEIPYAAPPIGENRFKPPKKHDGWTGILEATRNTKSCLQRNQYLGLNSSEDCLYLNVYTPVVTSQTKLPVVVYFHGGSLVFGSASFQQHNPKYLMDHDVVVVTVDYRLGPFGFLTTGDNVIPGNIGLRDQHFALEWVQKNIDLFSGDPSKVTIWGESAGSRSVSYHLLSPKSKGLFRSAILFSGTAVAHIAYTSYKIENALNLAKAMDPSFNSESSKDILELLMKYSGEEILEADPNKGMERDIRFFLDEVWNPVLENKGDPDAFLTAPFHESYMNGSFNHVPLLYGFDSEESLYFIEDEDMAKEGAAKADTDDAKLLSDKLHIHPSEKLAAGREIKMIFTNTSFKDDLAAYIKFCSDSILRVGTLRAAELTSQYVPVYLFQFSHSGYAAEIVGNSFSLPGTGKVGHTEELYYILKESPHELQGSDLLVRNRFVKLITNFIKHLNPTPTQDKLLEDIIWPTVSKETMQYLNINDTFEILSNPTRYASYRDTLLKYIQKPFDIFS